MLPSKNIQSIIGATLFGADNEKLGRISQVFVDAGDGHPTWAEVHVGALGRHSTFVPLDDATWEHDDVTVPFTKDDVKNAPRPDAEGGLSPAQEDELRRHYRHDDDSMDRPEPRHAVDESSPDADGEVWEERVVDREKRVPVANVTEERGSTADETVTKNDSV